MDNRKLIDIIKEAEEKNLKISDLVKKNQAEELCTKEENIYARMEKYFDVLENSVDKSNDLKNIKLSILPNDDGQKMYEYAKNKHLLLGEDVDIAVAMAISVAEYNASMGKILAAPTAGSCGILPGCLISLYRKHHFDKKDLVNSMITASYVGLVIAENSSIAGVSGGCMTECGTAAAMASSAIVELFGGTPSMIGEAVSMAIKNQLGLTCDPVAGLVEVPCIKRNAQGVVTAFLASDMALAGLKSGIPVDEVILVMKETGDKMDPSLKETACGGLATTDTGKSVRKRKFGK